MRNNSLEKNEFGPVVQEEMSFKYISVLELLQPICSAEQNHLSNYGRGHHEEQFCKIILNLDLWFKTRCRLKGISDLELWQPFCSAERHHLCYFGRGHHKEDFCEIILKFDQWFRRMSFKIFLIWSSGGPLVHGVESGR